MKSKQRTTQTPLNLGRFDGVDNMKAFVKRVGHRWLEYVYFCPVCDPLCAEPITTLRCQEVGGSQAFAYDLVVTVPKPGDAYSKSYSSARLKMLRHRRDPSHREAVVFEAINSAIAPSKEWGPWKERGEWLNRLSNVTWRTAPLKK